MYLANRFLVENTVCYKNFRLIRSQKDDYQNFTYLDYSEIENNNTNFVPISIHLLPGENFIVLNSLNYGCRLALTNFRIIIIYDVFKDSTPTSDIISIPFGIIYHLEQFGFVCLNIVTKIGKKFSVTFPNMELCEEIIQKIKKARADKPFAIIFYETLKLEIPTHFLLNYSFHLLNTEKEIIKKEFDRMQFSEDFWRISSINEGFGICSTYPQYHIVPKSFSDNLIKEMAKFRSKGRFISVSYRSIETGTVMLRSGQPLTGVSCWRNEADEKYFHVINENRTYENPTAEGAQLKIFDARSYTSAQLNRVKGGGMESDTTYSIKSLEFLNIPNMHAVRNSFESLTKALLENDSDKRFSVHYLKIPYKDVIWKIRTRFYELIFKSNWLQLIRQLLKSASQITDTMCIKKISVLIHCSDGWDRTPQLVSLSQILMDPYYRTIEGFRILVYREWILFGHKFNERCALWPIDFSREYSPIFVQWLDCVYQLLQQFPDHFHFNETFLIKLATHVYSGLFGTFNTMISKTTETCNLWSFLCQREIHDFINPLYSPHKTFKLIKPKFQMIHIKLWTNLYFEGLNPNYYESYYPEKFTSEIPPEIDNIVMLNSFFNDGDDDDYEGEGEGTLPPRLSEIKDELNRSYCPLKFNSNRYNYFNTVIITNCLETIEKDPSDNSGVHLELDLDGLYKQKDLIGQFSESNRYHRHLYRNRIKTYQKKIESFKTQMIENCTGEDIEIITGVNNDLWSTCSQFFTIEEVIRWIPDHAVTHCSNCKIIFTFSLRKHHCRNCGRIFCHPCSNNNCPIPKQKLNYPVRVCDNCCRELSSDNDKKSAYNFLPYYISNLFTFFNH